MNFEALESPEASVPESADNDIAHWTRREFLRHGVSLGALAFIPAMAPNASGNGFQEVDAGIVRAASEGIGEVATLSGRVVRPPLENTKLYRADVGPLPDLTGFAAGDEVVVTWSNSTVTSIETMFREFTSVVTRTHDDLINTKDGSIRLIDSTDGGVDPESGQPLPVPEFVAGQTLRGTVWYDGHSRRVIGARLLAGSSG